MLKQIRGALKGVGAFFVIALLVIAFAAWGVPEIRQFTQSYAVRVGDEGVSALEVQKEFDRFATNRRLANDGQFDRQAAIEAGMHNQIVQSLAARSALDQEAEEIGLSMPREMVRSYLQSSEQFKNPRTGKFDNEALTGIMREYNYGVREFEDRLQSDLLRNQLISAISAGGSAPKAFIDALVLRETENRTVSYLTITPDLAGEAAKATPAAFKEYYKQNSAQFMAPEYRTFSAIILKNSDYVDGEQSSEAELRKLYDVNKARYETPERRTIYQITYSDAAKAQDAAEALKSGKPFEELARENGQTLDDVTLTDVQQRDILDPKVGEAAFAAAEEGAVVGPVAGVFGHSVAQVAAITPASVKSFEEARPELEAETQGRESKKRLFETIETIENERDTGASLADAAAKAGTIAIEYGPVDSFSFGSGGEIIAGVPGDVLKEAFRLEEGEESDAVEFKDQSGYYFVSVSEVTPPSIMPYARVKEEVESRWRAAETDRRLSATVRSIREALDEGKTLRQAAEQINRAPIIEKVTRRDAGPILSEPLLEQIFSAAKGETISGPAASGDAQVIVTIDDIAYDVGRVAGDDIAVFRQYVGNQLNQELVDAYSNAVLADAGVKINQSQIDALFTDGQ